MNPDANRRQVLYWRLLARLFDPEEQPALEAASVAVVDDLGLPAALLDPSVSVDTVVQRFPDLAGELTGLLTPPEPSPGPEPAAGAGSAPPADEAVPPGDGPAPPAGGAEVRRAALVSKLLLNVFATGGGSVSATQLARWQSDAGWFERALGCEPGDLRRQAGNGRDGGGLGGVLAGLEGDLVRRMHLREVLADPKLAAKLTPSMSLIEQLLRDKSNLSGVALANAKALIRRYVDEVAEVLRTQVEQTSVGTIDRSVPPKRVFRNLDLDRTIWKNLTNWSPEDQRLYVDRLFYRQTARRTTPARLIVVVDQSGSMVDSMVNCTILASIFAGLPKVDVHLIAYDTRALDLTPWVHDPFEVLLRTKLGGGNDGPVAMAMARPKITEPRNTVLVWISDFYEFDRSQPLFDGIEAVHRSGVKFIPVGSVNSSGTQIVNPWFRQRFKDLGTPVISGHIRKLVFELKNFLT
ncbi:MULTISPECIES: VWA domain-containing protein [unclassified Micromonospora]|uniref:VWA domain-containing protein n=1 Tax=unclassified Micromonospora TaxID=2617518 RepID=UPI0009C5E6A0|nr:MULTISPECIES: VWA domain-containing protein [unclassified Micromonospora]MDI5939270.1 VWA domain-containing protein [Micromonospora sp. DH15]OON30397.1 VWA containing CoxE family protein [Micromonospora sp. Rc5]